MYSLLPLHITAPTASVSVCHGVSNCERDANVLHAMVRLAKAVSYVTNKALYVKDAKGVI